MREIEVYKIFHHFKKLYMSYIIKVLIIVLYFRDACGVMVIIIENGHGDPSSNPG